MGNCQTSMYCCGQNDSTENMGQNGESGQVSNPSDGLLFLRVRLLRGLYAHRLVCPLLHLLEFIEPTLTFSF